MLLCIDPGTSYCGASLVSKDVKDGPLQLIETNLLDVTRAPKEQSEKDYSKKFGKRATRILRIVSGISEIVERHKGKIEVAAIELPFYNRRTPMAFQSIVEINGLITYLLSTKFGIVTYGWDPRTVKLEWAGSGNASKDQMRDTLLGRKKKGLIHIPEHIVAEDIYEHCIDSIAVGHCYYERIEGVINGLDKKPTKRK